MPDFRENPKTWEEFALNNLKNLTLGEKPFEDHKGRRGTAFTISHKRLKDASTPRSEATPQSVLEDQMLSDFDGDTFKNIFDAYEADFGQKYYNPVYIIANNYVTTGYDTCFVHLTALESRMEYLDKKGQLNECMSQYGNLVKFLALADIETFKAYKDRIGGWLRSCSMETKGWEGNNNADTVKIFKRVENIKKLENSFEDNIAAIEKAIEETNEDVRDIND